MLGPGPHLRIPFIDRIFVQGVRLRTIADTAQTVTTRDGKNLTLAVVVSYAIDDIQKLYLSLTNPEVTLLNRVQGAIASVVHESESVGLSVQSLREKVLVRLQVGDWGLGQFDVAVTTFVYVRAFRLLGDGYRSVTQAQKSRSTVTSNQREQQWQT
jgi:hypothetical protein